MTRGVAGVPTYPLSAVLGQDALVEALLVNAVGPDVGGVLVRGERGTAKSTAVRALASLLPSVRVAADQVHAFAPGERAPHGPVPGDAPVVDRPAPLVELPVGASLDRLVGSLDFARALAGVHAFEPGLLARAHGGVLYVDEVNLLPDHLVDALLDAAASGIARVEREAVSVEHDARFVLVGTMNVEEGELRPQFLDRFGLGVDVAGPEDPAERAEIVRRRLQFDRDPDRFRTAWREQEDALAARIADARRRLPAVELPGRELIRITTACARLAIEGVRGDIVCARTARVLAALDGADIVTEEHVRRAARLALAHRCRRDPLAPSSGTGDAIDEAFGDPPPDDDGPGGTPPPAGPGPGGERAEPATGGAGDAGPGTAVPADRDGRVSAPAPPGASSPEPATIPRAALALAGTGTGPAGRHSRAAGRDAAVIDSHAGRAGDDDIAAAATLLRRVVDPSAPIRTNVRSGREGVLACMVIDVSGSMGSRRRLARIKGALRSLLRDAHARRDRVAIVCFSGGAARVAVRPGAPLETAARVIDGLAAGGRTPLAAGLRTATELVRTERIRNPEQRSVAVVLTDGRVADRDGAIGAAARALGRAADAVHVIDTESGPVRVGLAAALASQAGGQVHALGVIHSERRVA